MTDFGRFLEEIGLTQAQMDAAAAAMPAPRKEANARYSVRPSGIHGVGCFANERISGRVGTLKCGEWFEAGRYINHSPTPNAVARMESGALVAYGEIGAGEEITLDYRQVRNSMDGES